LQLGYPHQHKTPFVQAIHAKSNIGDKKQTLYNLFAAYLHTIPLEESITIDEASFEGMLASLEDSWND
jgi:hypothetical protein